VVLLVIAWQVHGTVWIAVFDSFYIASLFAYRFGQWWWSVFWYQSV
jgi:hypothetical protein